MDSCSIKTKTNELHRVKEFRDLVSNAKDSDGDERIAFEYKLLLLLEQVLGISRNDIAEYVKIYRDAEPGYLHKESLRLFMKKNELVNDHVASVFTCISSLLPIGFVEILVENECVCKSYDKVLQKIYGSVKRTRKRLITEEHDPSAVKSISNCTISNMMKYPGLKLYFTKNMMQMAEDQRMYFIVKHLKREDFEYYLNVLADESNDSRYKDMLDEYMINGVATEPSAEYHVFMSLYRYIRAKTDDTQILEKMLRTYNAEKLLEDSIGKMFVSRTIGYIACRVDEVEICRSTVHDVLKASNSREIDDIVWNALKDKRLVFLECIERFKAPADQSLASILMHSKCICENRRVPISKAMSYGEGIYRNEAVQYINDRFMLHEIVDAALNTSEDERDFLLECIYRKSLIGELDIRVLGIEDAGWIDKTLDEVFKVMDPTMYEILLTNKPEMAFDYCFRHSELRKRYFDGVDKMKCTVEEAICIHKILKEELCINNNSEVMVNSYASFVYGDEEPGNAIYMASTLANPKQIGNILEFVYLLTLIRPGDARYYFCEYFREICSQANSKELAENDLLGVSGHEVLGFDDVRMIYSMPLYIMLEHIFSTHLKDKYLVYTIMDDLIDAIHIGGQAFRLLVLKAMNSNLVAPQHLVDFIGMVTVLIHDSNVQICYESRRLLMEIPVASPELKCLKSQMMQAIMDRIYAKSFFDAFKTQQFNHYLCFNGLNLLVQALNMHMKEFRADVFPILKSLRFFAHPSDLKSLIPIIFENLSLFVIENAFYTDECCEVVSPLMRFGACISFQRLLDSIGQSLRVNKFLVKSLRSCEENMVDEVISQIIRKGSGTHEANELYVEPYFLAYAPELSIFEKYVPVFMPFLKKLFVDSDYARQEIAFKAFESMDVIDFLLYCCIVGQWKSRLLCIELFDKKGAADGRMLAMLFILKNDTHSALRKRAFEIWKSRIPNTNLALKEIYTIVLGCLKYQGCSGSFHDAMEGALIDMVLKYTKYVEKYVTDVMEQAASGFIDESIVNPLGTGEDLSMLEGVSQSKVVETILIECVKAEKCVDIALEFSIRKCSIDIFKLLLNNSLYRSRVIDVIGERIDDPAICQLFLGNGQLVHDLFIMTRKTFLFKFLSNFHKTNLAELLFESEHENAEYIKELMRFSEPSKKMEQLLLVHRPIYTSIFYGSLDKAEDYGCAVDLFKRVFDVLEYADLAPLIKKQYLEYLLCVSYKNVDDPQAMVDVLCTSDSIKALERLDEILMQTRVANVSAVCGHLLRNYLSYEKREPVITCLKTLKEKYEKSLDIFGLMIDRILGDDKC
ncbi:hypothetical protein HK407_02g03350 [Ordospora pajunii]|uniref:uncharacterized protein n=1 Tax=Ordospora pajunii TaxID=3039483 RepID=UPI00295274A6|nr:uncharacterized protein HK407_02g03350 [Ordospora pajunii]KAH9411891.1 hypothetical protein HK407_02g03350 [Ordospora pajunii]